MLDFTEFTEIHFTSCGEDASYKYIRVLHDLLSVSDPYQIG